MKSGTICRPFFELDGAFHDFIVIRKLLHFVREMGKFMGNSSVQKSRQIVAKCYSGKSSNNRDERNYIVNHAN